MRLETFQMERMQSIYDRQVEWNLTESGVLPVTARELLGGDGGGTWLLDEPLGYAETGGSGVLRERIADWYPGASPENVGVTNGGSEANYCVFWSFLGDGGRAAIMLPNYLQGWGLARAYGAADAFHLQLRGTGGRRRWELDIEELERSVGPETRIVLVTNPNNPTGAVLSEQEMEAVVRVARRARAWLVADEIYRGTEVDRQEETATFWGRYERVIVTSGVSKVFGLPGLRVGWVVAPKRAVDELFRHHDYVSIMHPLLSDLIAAAALEPSSRARLLARARGIVRANLPSLEEWILGHGEIFDYARPEAGAIAYVRSRLPVSTRQLAERIRREQSVLVLPGELFGVGRGFRFGYGQERQAMLEGLARVDRVLEGVAHGGR